MPQYETPEGDRGAEFAASPLPDTARQRQSLNASYDEFPRPLMTLQPEASIFLEESDGAFEIPNSLRSVESSDDSLDIEDEKTEEFQDAEAILFNLPECKN